MKVCGVPISAVHETVLVVGGQIIVGISYWIKRVMMKVETFLYLIF